ncbi:MAG TPA: hypothetical protein VFR22_10275, partial [Nocardioidaceae bacterium]|nr:hypothetical protein [Nocardioidaceae bacterium]
MAECVDAGRHPVVVRGLPTWDGYRTPPSRADADRDPQLPDLVPLLVMAGIGVPMAFACMQDGRLVQDVVAADVPTPPAEGAQGRALELHIEAGFARFKPDHVGLYCIYNDDRVGTILAPLHPDLIPADIAGPLSTARPKSLVKGTLDELDPASAIVERDDAFRVNYDLGYFEFDLTPEQQSALDALTSIVESSCRRVVLGPGEMVIWDNH